MINLQRVRNIFRACVAQENTSNTKKVITGWDHEYIFNIDKVEEYKEEIYALLKELPKEFQSNTGGGWSILNVCMDKYNDEPWGEQADADLLMALGIATEYAATLGENAPREARYFIVFNDDPPEEESPPPKKSVLKSILYLAGGVTYAVIIILAVLILVPIGALKWAFQKLIAH